MKLKCVYCDTVFTSPTEKQGFPCPTCRSSKTTKESDRTNMYLKPEEKMDLLKSMQRNYIGGQVEMNRDLARFINEELWDIKKKLNYRPKTRKRKKDIFDPIDDDGDDE